MSHRFSEELKDDEIRYKSFNFHKLNIQNGIRRKSSTKFKSVRTTSHKKLVLSEEIDLSDTIYANGKFMTEEMPKYVDADNAKEYLRNIISNFNYSSSEGDEESTTNVKKKQTENFSRKLYNSERIKMKPSKLKSNRDDINNNTTKSQSTKHLHGKKHISGKFLKKAKRSVENVRGNVTKQQVNYDDKTIRIIKKPNSIDQLGEPNGKYSNALSMEQKLNGYIQKLIRKFEDSPNNEISPYMLPPKMAKQKNYKSKATIVTPADTNELFGKFNPDKKNSEHNGTSVMAKTKISNAVLHSSKYSSKSNINPKTVSKTKQDETYGNCYSRPHNITKFHDFSKNKENRVKSRILSKIEKNEVNRGDFVPSVTKLRNKEIRISSKPERNETTRDDCLPYTSPPLTGNRSTNKHSVRKTSSISVIPEKQNSLPVETQVSHGKVKELNKIIASKAISHAIENKSSDTKCLPLPQKRVSKIKELVNDITNEGSSQVTEDKKLDLKSLLVQKTQLSQIKELLQVIPSEESSPKCLPVPENEQFNNKIKPLLKIAEIEGSLEAMGKSNNLEQSNKNEKFTAPASVVLCKPRRALLIKQNPSMGVYPRPIKSISWTSLASARSRMDITKMNHRKPKSYVCSKGKKQWKNTKLKNLKQMPNGVQTKKSSLTFVLSYKDTLFHISSTIFHSSMSVPSIKKINTSPNNNDIIVTSNSQNAIKMFKFDSNLNQTIEYKDAVDFCSVIQLFAANTKINKETVDENKRTFEISMKKKKRMTKKKCCSHNTVVLCQRRPEYWWIRAQMRNGSKYVKKCNCDYCKTMSKYLPQIEHSTASNISTSSENSGNESSESDSLDADSLRNEKSSYENLVKIDPLYTKLMADTKQNKLAPLLKYEPHSCCYSFNCEICRNTLQTIAYCRTNRSETDLNLISKLKEHKHEVNSDQDKNRYDINRSSNSRRNIFRKIKISTSRNLANSKLVVKTALTEQATKSAKIAPPVEKKTATDKNSGKMELRVSPKMYLPANLTIPIKPALNGGNMKLTNSQEMSQELIKKKNKEASVTIFSELRNVLIMFASFHFKILDFITFGKLNVFRK